MPTIIAMLTITAIPAFTDNYIWAMSQDGKAAVVDPGDAAPVLTWLATNGLQLSAILVTHHHPDHTGGIRALLREHPVPVHGPRAEAARIPGLTTLLADGDTVAVGGQDFQVLSVPGHTLGHIAYFTPGILFCGDTLFSAGCGRLFEGTPEQMYQSLTRLAALPGTTAVYCTHEYTEANLAFSLAAEPGNRDAAEHLKTVAALRASGHASLPSTLALERRINPFLRTGVAAVIHRAEQRAGRRLVNPAEVFAALRQWKDEFRAPETV